MEHSYLNGERVEKQILFGRLVGCWIPAQVINVNAERGTVNVWVLNHVGYKMTKYHDDVPMCYVRRPKYKFKVGDEVYTRIVSGRKQGLWIPANLIFLNHDGTFDLLVEQYKTYLVSKYSMHVPEKYLIPGDSYIMGRGSTSSSNMPISNPNSYVKNESPESKNRIRNHCDWCRFCAGEEREVSKETKSSTSRGSFTINESYINNVQVFQSCGQHPSESRSLAPKRSITDKPSSPAIGRQSQLITRLSISIEANQFSSPRTSKREFKQRCCCRQGHLQPSSCDSFIIKPPVSNTNAFPNMNDNALSRESYEDLKTSLLPHNSLNDLIQNFENQQKKESEDERSQAKSPALQKLFSDYGEQYEWSITQPSPEMSPSCVSSYATTTDCDFPSPRKCASSFSSRFADRPMSRGGKSTKLSTPGSKYDFITSLVSQDKGTIFREDRISTLRVKGDNIKHKMIEMDTPLEELALWLSEGSNTKCESEKRRPQMVKRMSFREKMIPIQFRSGKNEGNKLSDLLGKCVDPSKQGLIIFVGPVNGKLSYKVSVFEKDNVNNMS